MADSAQADSSFPQFKSTLNTKRTIMGPMFDESGDEDESEYSFVHPYGDKRCHVKHRTMFDRLATNLNDIRMFGHAVRLHAEHKVMKLIEDDYESDSSNKHISKSKTINFMFDKAIGCTSTIRALAEEAGEINPCTGAFVTTGGTDSEKGSEQQQLQSQVRSPIKVVRKKKASEVESWEDVLKDDLTVTSDEIYSDEDSFSGSESSWSSESSYESERRPCTKAELRRKRNKFVQCRALEKAVAESDSDEEEAFDDSLGSCRRERAATLHTREMRPQRGRSLTRSNTKPTVSSSEEVELSPATSSSSSDVIDVSKDAFVKQMNWVSKEAAIVVSNDKAPDFLISSHIGPVVTNLNLSPLSGVMQLGDIIIRLNGEDVSSLEAHEVHDLFTKFEGRSIRVTYLRKSMLV